jgi:hypothetical protein
VAAQKYQSVWKIFATISFEPRSTLRRAYSGNLSPGISLSVDANMVDQHETVGAIWWNRSGGRAPEQGFWITALAWAEPGTNIVVRDP